MNRCTYGHATITLNSLYSCLKVILREVVRILLSDVEPSYGTLDSNNVDLKTVLQLKYYNKNVKQESGAMLERVSRQSVLQFGLPCAMWDAYPFSLKFLT